MTDLGHAMADDLEEKPSAKHDIASAKASIFDTLSKLRKWREEQLAECRMKQYLESEKSLQLPKDNQKQFEQILENRMKHQHSEPEDKPKEVVPEISDISSISLPNDLDICDTLQESSITGHLQRCFDDSAQSNTSVSGNKVLHAPEKVPVFSELRNPQFSENNLEEKDKSLAKTGMANGKITPKRPFLKKGTGLERYKLKPTNNYKKGSNKESPKKFPVIKDHLPQKTLKLKPALRKTDMPTEKAKHIRFDIGSHDNEDIEAPKKVLLPASKTNENETDVNIHEKNVAKHPIPAASTSPENNKLDISSPESENLNLSRESKELEEFEMLENCAQNSSFNSESSVVQRLLQVGPAKPSCANDNYTRPPSQNTTSMRNELHVNPSENPNYCEEISLNKCRDEVRARKQELQEVISDINPRIESLQKEISYNQKQALDDSYDSDRCSTPVNFEDRNPIPECDSNAGSSVFEISPEVQINHFINDANEAVSQSNCTCCNVDNACKNFYTAQDHEHICRDKEECTCNYSDEADENDLDFNGKSKIRTKLIELQNEIETYQQLNAKLSSQRKERDDIMRKLQKEQEEFNKYKEAEMQKLEAHIEEERRQIKRQKETFNRYQKLRKDNPTKKERDELSSLRLEIEKLHEDLKRQKIKYNSDSRRWKTRLDNAERERDNFKLENIRLEEQCQDLLATLKARMKKNIKSLDDDCDHVHKDNAENIVEKKDAESQTEAKDLGLNVVQDSKHSSPDSTGVKKSKSKTPFTLVSEFDKLNVNLIDKDLDDHARDQSKNDNFYCEQNGLINKSDNMKRNEEKPTTNDNLSVISVSSEHEFKEINHGNSIERIYSSGEREIIFNSGTRKIISADGNSRKFFFYNGDIKEILSDGQEIYTYVNGVIETTFPDGLKITEYPNGQIQRRYPNGQNEVRFSDGTVHNILPDGSEEIRTIDGNLIKKCSDGSKITDFANGQREIVTSSYKRREFPDGSLKILYQSGRQETRYSNGRIRIKDKSGKVLFDTKYLSTTKETCTSSSTNEQLSVKKRINKIGSSESSG